MTTRQLGEVADALAAGRAVAVPGDGGYQLAVLHSRPGGLDRWRAVGAPAHNAGVYAVVGSRAQAAALTTQWNTQTAHLTDRMWPGPLTVVLPVRKDSVPAASGDAVVHLTMPSWRPLRTLVRRSGPLSVMLLARADGGPLTRAGDVQARLIDTDDVSFVLDGGTRGGPSPTVVDCTQSPPMVQWVGALPESYVQAALLMGDRTRRWFTRKNADDTLG